MKTPKFLSPYVDGVSPTRLIQGLVVGAVATIIIGFNWGGWHLESTLEKMVASATETATVTALAPICVDRFSRAAKTDNTLVAALEAESSWKRDSYMMDNGWATFSGAPEPNRIVAEACAKMLNKSMELK